MGSALIPTASPDPPQQDVKQPDEPYLVRVASPTIHGKAGCRNRANTSCTKCHSRRVRLNEATCQQATLKQMDQPESAIEHTPKPAPGSAVASAVFEIIAQESLTNYREGILSGQ
jgi:hypothetical protein